MFQLILRSIAIFGAIFLFAPVNGAGSNNNILKGTGACASFTYPAHRFLKSWSHSGSSLDLRGFSQEATVRGTDGEDTLIGTNLSDWIFGGVGNDLLRGEAGNDVLYGGIGNDQIYGGSGADFLHGGKGDDVLYGDRGDDILVDDFGVNEMHGANPTYSGTAEDGDDTFVFLGNGEKLTIYDKGGHNSLVCPYMHSGGIARWKGADLEINFSFRGSVTIKDYRDFHFSCIQCGLIEIVE